MKNELKRKGEWYERSNTWSHDMRAWGIGSISTCLGNHIFNIWRQLMSDKQYLEAVYSALVSTYVKLGTTPHNLVAVEQETERRLAALKAQEDNIKSDHWEEK